MSRSQFRTLWSSGFAASVYALVLPTVAIPAHAGQNESNPPQSRETTKGPEKAKSAQPKAVVVITGALDLGKITIADYGDVEPPTH